jgi:RNA polymerase sigma-70 factor (ECF subfamily)
VDAAYNVARHLLNEPDARDVVQDSLMRAWRYFGSFRGTEALPWLLQIVRNSAYTMMSRRQGHQEMPEDLAIVDEAAVDPATQLAVKADAEGVQRAMEKLPAIYREVLVLREMEGLSYKEIADVTGATMGTVMSRISRARRQLEMMLGISTPAQEKEVRHDL